MIEEYFAALTETLSSLDHAEVARSVSAVQHALLSGSRVCTIGNGGSSATASHFVNDWIKGFSLDRNINCDVVCLSDNTPTFTAIGNDLSYQDVFSFLVQRLMKAGDTLVCISGSGNSSNIIHAAQLAKSRGITVVGLTGFDGGKLKQISDFSFHVPIDDMQITEDLHMSFGHLVLRL